jgi:hypothetical protein
MDEIFLGTDKALRQKRLISGACFYFRINYNYMEDTCSRQIFAKINFKFGPDVRISSIPGCFFWDGNLDEAFAKGRFRAPENRGPDGVGMETRKA